MYVSKKCTYYFASSDNSNIFPISMFFTRYRVPGESNHRKGIKRKIKEVKQSGVLVYLFQSGRQLEQYKSCFFLLATYTWQRLTFRSWNNFSLARRGKAFRSNCSKCLTNLHHNVFVHFYVFSQPIASWLLDQFD